jgi:hypothetical protein
MKMPFIGCDATRRNISEDGILQIQNILLCINIFQITIINLPNPSGRPRSWGNSNEYKKKKNNISAE